MQSPFIEAGKGNPVDKKISLEQAKVSGIHPFPFLKQSYCKGRAP